MVECLSNLGTGGYTSAPFHPIGDMLVRYIVSVATRENSMVLSGQFWTTVKVPYLFVITFLVFSLARLALAKMIQTDILGYVTVSHVCEKVKL